MPNGEELLGQTKMTAPPPHFQNFLVFQIGALSSEKTLLTTKRRKKIYAKGKISFTQGNTYLAKTKAFEKGGNFFKT
jgi:hypothetical protein